MSNWLARRKYFVRISFCIQLLFSMFSTSVPICFVLYNSFYDVCWEQNKTTLDSQGLGHGHHLLIARKYYFFSLADCLEHWDLPFNSPGTHLEARLQINIVAIWQMPSKGLQQRIRFLHKLDLDTRLKKSIGEREFKFSDWTHFWHMKMRAASLENCNSKCVPCELNLNCILGSFIWIFSVNGWENSLKFFMFDIACPPFTFLSFSVLS